MESLEIMESHLEIIEAGRDPGISADQKVAIRHQYNAASRKCNFSMCCKRLFPNAIAKYQ